MPSTRGTNETFSRTVLAGSSLKSWNTKPSERRYACTCRARQRRQVAAADDELTLGRHVLAQQQPEQRGLAGAARPGEKHEVAFVDAQRQIAQRVHAASCTSSKRSAPRSRGVPVELAPHERVDQRRIGFSAHGLDHLTDEEAVRLLLAGAVLRRRRRRARRAPACTAASTALSSSIRPSPSAATIAAAVRPVAYIFSKTSLAVGPLIVPESTSRIKPASASGVERHVVDRRSRARSSCASARP